MDNICAVVLAAGDGKRMKSQNPKVLTRVLFKPMISWVLDNLEAAGISDICVVVSDTAEAVRAVLPKNCETCVQSERKGTGHATMMARSFLEARRDKRVLVLYGDAPFVDEQTIEGAFLRHQAGGNDLTVVGAEVENPFGFGRMITEGNKLLRVVEERDATDEQRQVKLINSGVYIFECDALLDALGEIPQSNAQGEYYLTDAVEIVGRSGKVEAYTAATSDVVLGANDRRQLSELNEIARRRELHRLMDGGVDIPCIDGILVEPGVQVGADTLILPGCVLRGGTTVGKGCVIGPNTTVEDSHIGDNVKLESSVVENSAVANGAKLGPWVHLRPGSSIGEEVKIGNFVEIKNTNIGANTSVAHLTYLGDSDVGEYVNVGCGVVTANYDGGSKHRTVIGDRAFIGCNTNFIAPVQVGAGAVTAAGTTVTEDVPDGALAIGRANQINRADWAARKGKYKKGKK